MSRAVGQPLAPPPSDLEEILATSAPLDSNVPFDPAMETEYTGSARATTTSRTSRPKVTLYGHLGDDREVTVEDLLIVTSPELSADRRLYTRCPQCVKMSNGGIHQFSGPNSCPAKSRKKFMTCPVCASYGRDKRVYEGDALVATLDDATNADPDYLAADLPDAASSREQLQDKLYQHMTAFHSSETNTLYGVGREVDGNGFRIVRRRHA